MASDESSTQCETEAQSCEDDREKRLPPGPCQKLLPVDSKDLMKVIVDSTSMVKLKSGLLIHTFHVNHFHKILYL